MKNLTIIINLFFYSILFYINDQIIIIKFYINLLYILKNIYSVSK